MRSRRRLHLLLQKLLAWLRENPVTDLVDREWLIREENKVYDLLTRATEAVFSK